MVRIYINFTLYNIFPRSIVAFLRKLQIKGDTRYVNAITSNALLDGLHGRFLTAKIEHHLSGSVVRIQAREREKFQDTLYLLYTPRPQWMRGKIHLGALALKHYLLVYSATTTVTLVTSAPRVLAGVD